MFPLSYTCTRRVYTGDSQSGVWGREQDVENFFLSIYQNFFQATPVFLIISILSDLAMLVLLEKHIFKVKLFV